MERTVVLDAGVLIRGVDIRKLGSIFVSTPQVMAEVRDNFARTQLQQQLMLSDITIRSPPEDAIKIVMEFARKTGDGQQLSANDVGVIALAYQLENELTGGVTLRAEPPTVRAQVGKATPSDSVSVTSSRRAQSTPAPSADATVLSDKVVSSEQPGDHAEGDELAEDDGEGSENLSDLSDDDEEGWITPENVAEHMQRENEGFVEAVDPEAKVVVATTDYAMQNVILQMNLLLVGPDGMRIKSIRQYALKCQACSKVTHDMNKKFCPMCGNATLYRVAVITDKTGNVVHYNARLPRSMLRGTKFAIPKPTGGRNNSDLILREDQFMEQRRKRRTKKSAGMPDVFEEDYQFGDHNKQTVSRTGRAIHARNATDLKIGYGRTNPNVVRRSRK